MSDDAEQAPSTDAVQTIQRRTWIRGIVGVVGAIVVLVVLGWVAGSISNHFALSPGEAALAAIEDAPDARVAAADSLGGPEAIVHWSDGLDQAVLVARGLPDLAPDQEFAVWYVSEEATTRIVAFIPGTGPATVLLPARWAEGEIVRVSIEPQGGSSSGEPTGETLLTIDPAQAVGIEGE